MTVADAVLITERGPDEAKHTRFLPCSRRRPSWLSASDEVLTVAPGLCGDFETRLLSDFTLRKTLTTTQPSCAPCLANFPPVDEYDCGESVAESASLCVATRDRIHVSASSGATFECPLPSPVHGKAYFSSLFAPACGLIAEVTYLDSTKVSYYWASHPQEEMYPIGALPTSHRLTFVSTDVPIAVSYASGSFTIWNLAPVSSCMPFNESSDSLDGPVPSSSNGIFCGGKSNPETTVKSNKFCAEAVQTVKISGCSSVSSTVLALTELYRKEISNDEAKDSKPVICCLSHSCLGGILLCVLSSETLSVFSVEFAENGQISVKESFGISNVVSIAGVVATRANENSLDLLLLYSSGRLCINIGNREILTVNLFPVIENPAIGAQENSIIADLEDAVGCRVSVMRKDGTLLRYSFKEMSFSSLLVAECIAVISSALMAKDAEDVLFALRKSMIDGGGSESGHRICEDREWIVFVNALQTIVFPESSHFESSEGMRPDHEREAWNLLLKSEFHLVEGQTSALSAFLSPEHATRISPTTRDCRETMFGRPHAVHPVVVSILEALHMLYESKKLSVTSSADSRRIALCNAELSNILGLGDFTDYYQRDYGKLCHYSSTGEKRSVEYRPFGGCIPSIFEWTTNIIQSYGGTDKANGKIPSSGPTTPCARPVTSSCRSLPFSCESAFPLLLGEKSLAHSRYGCLHSSWRQHSPLHLLRCVERYFLVLFGNSDSTGAEAHCLSRPMALLHEMLHDGFGRQNIDMLPCGLSLPLRDALWACGLAASLSLPKSAETLIGREDLSSDVEYRRRPSWCKTDLQREIGTDSRFYATKHAREIRALLGIQSAAATYDDGMSLELSPAVQMQSSLRERALGRSTFAADVSVSRHLNYFPENTVSGHVQSSFVKEVASDDVGDGCDLNDAIFGLRFGEDRRLSEVRCMLRSTEPVLVRATAAQDGSEDGLEIDRSVELQTKVAILLKRHLAVPIGRGAFTLRTYTPADPTMPLGIPSICLVGKVAGQKGSRIKVNEENGAFPVDWGEFHNGVAAGLRLVALDADADGQGFSMLTRTWIVKHRPTNRSGNASHAGMLLGLGLGGYLPALRTTDYYEYLIPMHDLTSIGLMLGVAAGNKGSMNAKVAKMLCVHVRHFNSPGFAVPDFHVSANVQTAAILGLGLLYQGTAEHHIVEGLLEELSRKPEPGDPIDDREGLALAAGLAIGNICLGMSSSLPILADLRLQETLFHLATGGANSVRESMLLTNGAGLAHYPRGPRVSAGGSGPLPPGTAESETYRIKESDCINIDVSGPGAILALALIFLKSNNSNIAERLLIPNSMYALKRTRPDHIYIRCLARHVIMWDNIHPSTDWILESLPALLRPPTSSRRESGVDLFRIGKDKNMGDIDAEVDEAGILLGRAFAVAGASTAIALRYAGTCNALAVQALSSICRSFEISLKRHVSGNEESEWMYTTCLNSLVLALAVVASGSGSIKIFRLLRRIRKRSGPSLRQYRYGTHMAIHMAIGFLFLGGGCLTFGSSNEAVAALLISIYHRFPLYIHDNRYHLQAMRHLYVLAVEPRCIEARDVDTNLPCKVSLQLSLRPTAISEWQNEMTVIAPCLVPHGSLIDAVAVTSDRYWPKIVQIPSSKTGEGWFSSTRRYILYVKRRAGHLPYALDPTGSKGMLARSFGTMQRRTESDGDTVAHLVCAFSADPRMLTFVRHFCSIAGAANSKSDLFREVLFESLLQNKPEAVQCYAEIDRAASTVAGAPPCPLLIGSLLVIAEYSLVTTEWNPNLVRSDFMYSAVASAQRHLCSNSLRQALVRYVISGGRMWPSPSVVHDDSVDQFTLLGRFLQLFRIPCPSKLQKLAERLQFVCSNEISEQHCYTDVLQTTIAKHLPTGTPPAAFDTLMESILSFPDLLTT